MSDVTSRANKWILGHNVGTSSKTIWAVMMGAVTGREPWHQYDVPHDPDDFNRCYRLLVFIPEWKSRLPEVASIFPKWIGFVREWTKLTEMHENLNESNWNEMYDLMRSLEEEGLLADGWVKTSSCGWEKVGV